MPDQPGTLYTIATDSEATATTVSVSSKMAAARPDDRRRVPAADRRAAVQRHAVDRLAEIAQKPDAPFLARETSRGLFVRTAEATTLSALVTDDGVERGLEALFTEAERVARFGFTQTELDRQKLEHPAAPSSSRRRRTTSTPSASLADEYIRNFMQQEPIPGIDYEHGLHQRFLPEITLAEVNALARDWVPDRNRVVVVSAPQKAGLTVPDEATLAAVIRRAGGGALTAYVDTVSTQPLLDTLPDAGHRREDARRRRSAITEWQLSNGVRVVLKPTTFKQDEILVPGLQPRRHVARERRRLHRRRDRRPGRGQGGLGTLSAIDLSKMLTGKAAFVRPTSARWTKA